jgi:hypothetical protein
MRGEQVWLEQGTMDIGLTAEAFKTRSLLGQRAECRGSVAAGSGS